MISTMNLLMDSWFDLLEGLITYSGKTVKIYKEDTPEDLDPTPTVSEHYILLRAEGETDQSNKKSFVNDTVIIVDIVTKFNNNVNRSVVDNIDNQINALVLTSPWITGLPAQSGMQILNVQRETTNYLYEGDNINKYYRKVSRYNARILQTS